MTTQHYTNAMEDGWMQTLTGRQFWSTRPRLMDIHLEDIAGSLSKQCRYAGHCVRFYSVAEHCVHVMRAASPENKLAALMHDASEAYLVDIPKPLKGLLPGYYDIEDKLMHLIAEKFQFQWPLPAEVKELDLALLRDERIQNMTTIPCPSELWGDVLEGTGARLQYWEPLQARNAFINAFFEAQGVANVA